MNAITLAPEMTLTAAAETVIDAVFRREAQAVNVHSRDLVTWESLSDFTEPLGVQRYINDDGLQNYGFKIQGDRPDEMVIFPGNVDEKTLVSDAYADYFFRRFVALFNAHPHVICLRSVRIAREKALREQTLFEQQQNSSADGQTIKITNKRKIII